MRPIDGRAESQFPSQRPSRRPSFLPSRNTLVGGLSALSVATAGCNGASVATVESHVEVVAASPSAMRNKDSLRTLNGTYGPHCSERSGSWSLPVGDSTIPLAHPRLSVIPNDADCVLTLTDLIATGAPDDAMLMNPTFAPPIVLTDSWANEHSLLMMNGVALRGNARLDTTSFTSDFAMSIIVSDDPMLDVAAAADGSVRASKVATPDYSLSMGDATEPSALRLTVDAARIVASVTGSATLTDGAKLGDHYVIDFGTLLGAADTWTFGMLHEAYGRATEYAIDGVDPKIAAERFGLLGEDISSGVTRTVIVSRTEHGVPSYQALTVTFRGPG